MKHIDKEIYIISDLVQNVIKKSGELPDKKEIADEWLSKVWIVNLNAFFTKYNDNTMKTFAQKLAQAYGDEIEREYHARFWSEERSFDKDGHINDKEDLT